VEKTGVEILARKNEKMQITKMQEWKYRHDFAGVENVEVETSAQFFHVCLWQEYDGVYGG